LQNDEKIINGQTLDFTQEKSPRKILGNGSLSKDLIIKAASFSLSKKIVKAGGKFEIMQN
jgi:ribosomal protein L15